MPRIVITGAGVVSSIGSGLEEFFDGLHGGSCGVDNISCFNTKFFPSALGAEAREHGQVIMTDHTVDRKALFMKKSLQQLFSANPLNGYDPADRIMHLGAGIDYFDFLGYARKSTEQDWRDYNLRANQVAVDLAKKFLIEGGSFVNVSACVASTQAMGLALRLLRDTTGKKAVITGGFDSMLSHLHYMGFYNLGALSTWSGNPAGACRPFAKDRCGLVIGEGASAYSLEQAECADNNKIFCELSGYGSSMDAYMITDPEPSGMNLAQAALMAIEDAGLTPDSIDTVDMHGTGTVKNALAEVKAMELVFGKRYREIPIFSLKGQVGHLIGACGALEVLGAIDTIQNQRILPSLNCEEPDPELQLNIVRNEPLEMKIEHVLKINAAFGGQNTALVLSKYGA